MADIVNNGDREPINLKTYKGVNGHVIVNLDLTPEKSDAPFDTPRHFMMMTAHEAQELSDNILTTIKQIKDEL